MIYGYAIEPESLIDWAKNKKDGRIILNSFGPGTSRLLKEYPKLKKWRKMLKKAYNNSDLTSEQKLKYAELIQLFTKQYIEFDSGIYNGNTPWINNVTKTTNKGCFKAIITKEKTAEISNHNILISSLCDEWPDSFWDIEKQITIPREANSIANVLAPMIQNSKLVKFVDPYFNICEERWLSIFKAILDKSISKNSINYPKCFEVHTSAMHAYSNRKKEESYRKNSIQIFKKILPADSSMIVYGWKMRNSGDKLHNRYILTNFGGVLFGTGLDKGEQGETDDISLLSGQSYQLRMAQYCDESTEFELDFRFEITK